jgi:hypothetical protein
MMKCCAGVEETYMDNLRGAVPDTGPSSKSKKPTATTFRLADEAVLVGDQAEFGHFQTVGLAININWKPPFALPSDAKPWRATTE